MAYGHREKGNCDDIELIVPPQPARRARSPPPPTASEIPRQDAADRRRQAGRRGAEIHRGQGDRHPDHRRARDVQRRPLRARQGTGGVRRRLHRPCRRLRPDGGRRQAGRLPCRQHRRQIHPGVRREGAAGCADRNHRRTPRRRPNRRLPTTGPPEPAEAGVQFHPDRCACRRRRSRSRDGNAWEIFKAKSDGTRGDNLTTEYGDYKGNLEPGDYVVVARDGEAKAEQKIKIEAGQVYKPLFTLNAGTLIIHPRPSEGADDQRWRGCRDRLSRRRDAGDLLWRHESRLAGRRPESDGHDRRRARSPRPFRLRPARPSKRTSSSASAMSSPMPTTPPAATRSDVRASTFQVVKAKKKIDGTREDVEHAYGPDSKFDLPPDDYVLITTLDQAAVEQPFSVKVGDTAGLDVIASMPACWRSPRPAPRRSRSSTPKKDIQGNRKSLGYAYGESTRPRCRPATMRSS